MKKNIAKALTRLNEADPICSFRDEECKVSVVLKTLSIEGEKALIVQLVPDFLPQGTAAMGIAYYGNHPEKAFWEDHSERLQELGQAEAVRLTLEEHFL
jgi:hypothetical protein